MSNVHVDLWRVTAYDLKGRPMLIARRVFTRHAAAVLADHWSGRTDIGRVELVTDEPAPTRGRTYR